MHMQEICRRSDGIGISAHVLWFSPPRLTKNARTGWKDFQVPLCTQEIAKALIPPRTVYWCRSSPWCIPGWSLLGSKQESLCNVIKSSKYWSNLLYKLNLPQAITFLKSEQQKRPCWPIVYNCAQETMLCDSFFFKIQVIFDKKHLLGKSRMLDMHKAD